MSPSLLSTALPSIHRISKKETNFISKKHHQPQQQQQQQRPARHHVRTSSAPLILPSYCEQKQDSKLSMDILLDAIDLDQQMRQFFRSEVVKSKNRNTTTTAPTFNPSHMMMARRRSKSAPGAPPSYHYQRAFTTRWITPENKTVTCASQAQQVAAMIVQQHIEAVKKR